MPVIDVETFPITNETFKNVCGYVSFSEGSVDCVDDMVVLYYGYYDVLMAMLMLMLMVILHIPCMLARLQWCYHVASKHHYNNLICL